MEQIRLNQRRGSTFYYIGIGTANHEKEYPIPENRHELPDFLLDLNYKNKVLILIDPATTEPLMNSPYNVIKINDTMYKIVELGIDIFVIRNTINIETNTRFLYELIEMMLCSDPNTLMMVSIYTGISIHDKQDMYINMFEPDKHKEIRSRFLLGSTYFKDFGCRYNITDPYNLPIFENNRFYNPGFLLPDEFNEELFNVYLNTDIVSLHKKSFLKSLFDININKYISYNISYNDNRKICNETTCIENKKYFRHEMLKHVNDLMEYLKLFINIDEFMNNLQENNIYGDLKKIKDISNSLFE